MRIIKLNAINSTNTYLKELSKDHSILDNTVVWSENQTSGRGQQDSKWISEPYKNLTFSILKRFDNFSSEHHFVLNMITSLSIFRCLKKLHIPDLTLKWPNDILSGDQKICGILIENTLVAETISTSVIGVGINVNQLYFNDLPRVSSLQKLTGIHYHLEEILQMLLKEFSVSFSNLQTTDFERIYQEYHSHLFRKDKPSTFEDLHQSRFMGFIRGVTSQGELCVELEDAIFKTFQLKQIRLLY